MRRRTVTIAALIIFSAAAAMSQQLTAQHPFTAEEILDRSVRAQGGVAALDSVSTIITKGYVSTDMGKRLPFEQYDKMPNKVLVVRTEPGRVSRTGFNGTDLWRQNGNDRATSAPGEVQYDTRNNLKFFLIHWRDSTRKAELSGTEEVFGRKALGVRMLPQEGRAFRLYFDPETFMLLREDTTRPVRGGGFDRVEVYYSDFRLVEGVVIPFRVDVVLHHGTPTIYSRHSTSITTEVHLNVPMDDSIFDKPR